MAFVSVTRLRLRSPRFLPAFFWHAVRSAIQAEKSPGCVGLRTMRDSDGSFWTVSAWESQEAMRAYITSGAHRQATPKLMEWCDEASTVHWEQEAAAVPDWPEACLRMAEEGRPYRLRHMSPEQAAAFTRSHPPQPPSLASERRGSQITFSDPLASERGSREARGESSAEGAFKVRENSRIPIAIIASVAGAAGLLAGCGRQQAAKPGAAFAQGGASGGPVLLAEAVTARAEAAPERTAAISGQVEPYEVATVAAEAAEVIAARPVERGDRIVKGQVIAVLDDRTARAALDRAVAANEQTTAARRQAESEYRRAVTETTAAQQQARAVLQSARAGEEKARSFTRTQELREAEAALDQVKTDEALALLERDRYKRLVDDGAIAEQVLDRQQAALDAASARRRAAEQRVSLAREGARREDIAAAAAQVKTAESGVLAAGSRPDRLAAIRAQIDSLRAQEDGAQAAVALARIELSKHVVRAPFAGRVLETLAEAGERVGPGSPLLRLGSTARVKLTFSVPEASRPGLKPGQTLRATADALPGRAFAARVSALGSQADQRTRAFPVELVADNPGERLLPGMVARLSLSPAGAAPRRVSVPVSAVAGEGSDTYVFLLEDDRAVRRTVTLGAPLGAERVVVRSGLTGGERLAAAPHRLTDGARVQTMTAAEARR